MNQLLIHEVKKLALPALLFLGLELLIGFTLPLTGGDNTANAGYIIVAVHLLFLAVLGSLTGGEERARGTELFTLCLPVSRFRILLTRIFAAAIPGILSMIIAVHFAWELLDHVSLKLLADWIHLPMAQLTTFAIILSSLTFLFALQFSQWLEQPITATLAAFILTGCLLFPLADFSPVVHPGWVQGLALIPLSIAPFSIYSGAALESPARRLKTGLLILISGIILIPPAMLWIQHWMYQHATSYRIYSIDDTFTVNGTGPHVIQASCLPHNITPFAPYQAEGLPRHFLYHPETSQLQRYPEDYTLHCTISADSSWRTLIRPRIRLGGIPDTREWQLDIADAAGRIRPLLPEYSLAWTVRGHFSPHNRYYVLLKRRGEDLIGPKSGTEIQIFRSPDWKMSASTVLPDWIFRTRWLDTAAGPDDEILYFSEIGWKRGFKGSFHRLWQLHTADGRHQDITPDLPENMAIDEFCVLKNHTLLLLLMKPSPGDFWKDRASAADAYAIYDLKSHALRILPAEWLPTAIPGLTSPWLSLPRSMIYQTGTGHLRYVLRKSDGADGFEIRELDPVSGSTEVLFSTATGKPGFHLIHSADRSRFVFTDSSTKDAGHWLFIDLESVQVSRIIPPDDEMKVNASSIRGLALTGQVYHFILNDRIYQVDMSDGNQLTTIALKDAADWQPAP